MATDENRVLSRRDFLSWSAVAVGAMLLPGCEPYAAPRATAPALSGPASDVALASPSVQPPVQYVYVQPEPPPARVATPLVGGKLSANSRNSWGATAAIPAKMKAMNGVTRVTIHHEGSAKPNNDASPAQVSATLRLIQSQHRKRLGAGDIGYHFIIDRTGTIWQGRDWAYQGAHTSGANANNIGVMLLGNFEIQQPTPQQLQSLQLLTASLIRKYGLNPAKDIYGHSDFCNTQCPGKHLKPHVTGMRRSLKV
ncbi:MAG: N-acetylmuramoyl-L-alanine amidase [Planctomycetes bacterium]|nr:N-acetylmuramoyl-L-alanine amidase [Planctomycetota bacterium]